MHVSVVGTGYVGTTLTNCLADLGHHVTAVDIDQAVVDRLNADETHIHEPGLEPLVSAYAGNGLIATTDHDVVTATDVTFLAVETPACNDGSIDTAALLAAAEDVGEAIAVEDDYHLVVMKSTVLPDVVEDELVPTIERASGRTDGKEFGVEAYEAADDIGMDHRIGEQFPSPAWGEAGRVSPADSGYSQKMARD